VNWKTDAERLSGNEEFLSVAQVMALQSWALSTLFPGQDHPKPNDVYSTFKAQMGCLAASFVKKTNASRSMIQRFFAEALAWDDRNTLASLRLAGYKSGQEGIECLERGRDMFDPDRGFDSRIMAYLLCDLGNRYWEERRSGDALKTYLASLEHDCTCFNAYKEVLCNFSDSASGQSPAWTSFLQFLAAIGRRAEEWANYLDDMVWYVLAQFSGRTMALAMEADTKSGPIKRWACIKKLHQIALNLAERQKYLECRFLACRSFASTLSFAVARDKDGKIAIEMLEKAIAIASQLGEEERGKESGKGQMILPISKRTFSHTAEQLARLYLHRLLILKNQEGEGKSVSSIHRDIGNVRAKLKQLLGRQNAHQENTMMSCYQARWRKADGRPLVEQMAAVAEVVKEALAMLVDETPANDQLACESLWRVAVTIGNTKIATAIWKLLYLFAVAAREFRTEKGKRATTDKEIAYSCDGCGKGLLVDELVYVCQDCAGEAKFDQSCHDRVVGNTNPRIERLCSHHHKFIRIASETIARIHRWGAESDGEGPIRVLAVRTPHHKAQSTTKERTSEGRYTIQHHMKVPRHSEVKAGSVEKAESDDDETKEEREKWLDGEYLRLSQKLRSYSPPPPPPRRRGEQNEGTRQRQMPTLSTREAYRNEVKWGGADMVLLPGEVQVSILGEMSKLEKDFGDWFFEGKY